MIEKVDNLPPETDEQACMKRFSLLQNKDETRNFVKHNINPEMLIEIAEEIDESEKLYDSVDFKGKTFYLIVRSGIEDEMELTDKHRLAIKKAWKWYRSQVYIE